MGGCNGGARGVGKGIASIINVGTCFSNSDFPFKTASLRRRRGLIKCIHSLELDDQNNISLLVPPMSHLNKHREVGTVCGWN